MVVFVVLVVCESVFSSEFLFVSSLFAAFVFFCWCLVCWMFSCFFVVLVGVESVGWFRFSLFFLLV